MARGKIRFELFLLFDKLKLNQVDMENWLKAKGNNDYSRQLIDDYYRYYLEAKEKVEGLI